MQGNLLSCCIYKASNIFFYISTHLLCFNVTHRIFFLSKSLRIYFTTKNPYSGPCSYMVSYVLGFLIIHINHFSFKGTKYVFNIEMTREWNFIFMLRSKRNIVKFLYLFETSFFYWFIFNWLNHQKSWLLQENFDLFLVLKYFVKDLKCISIFFFNLKLYICRM